MLSLYRASLPPANVCPKSRHQCNILLENFNKCHITSHKTRYPHINTQTGHNFPSLSLQVIMNASVWLLVMGTGLLCAGGGQCLWQRSHSLCGSDSGVRTLSDQSPPLLSSILIILIPGCRVCCVLIPIPAPSQRRVVPRVSEPFTGTITMSPGSRHQHQDHNINIRTSRAVIHPDSA